MTEPTAASDGPAAAPAEDTPDVGWSYRRKMILAPMVRVNSLAFRELCTEYGADMVYSEELVDRSLLACRRTENAERGTVEYRNSEGDGRVIFSTWAGRRERVVLQLGTACAADALRAAQHVGGDVRAIDINMGCPVKFSLQGGMGSALLTQPEKVRDILSTLRRNLPADLPVTCKIRLLEQSHDTLQLAKVIESCGVAALAVHARRKQDRPRVWAQWDMFRLLRDSMPSSLPIILNGDVFSPADLPRGYELTGADSLMLARGALWNPSIFEAGRGAPMRTQGEVASRFFELAAATGLPVGNLKYVCMQMLDGGGKTAPYTMIQRARNMEDMRAACAACREHAHFQATPGKPARTLEPPPDMPHAPQIPINSWRVIPTHWKHWQPAVVKPRHMARLAASAAEREATPDGQPSPAAAADEHARPMPPPGATEPDANGGAPTDADAAAGGESAPASVKRSFDEMEKGSSCDAGE